VERRSKLLSNLDWTTVFIYILLVLMGWLNIYAAVYSDEHSSIFDFSQRYGKQLIWIGFAFLLAIIVLFSDARIYSGFAYVFYILIILALFATLMFGKVVNASKSWIQVGSFAIQPAEFAKIATILALAKVMGRYNFKLNSFKSYVVAGFIAFFPALIILMQNDMGSALVFGSLIIVFFREGLPGWLLAFFAFLVMLFIFTLVFSTSAIMVTLLLLAGIVFVVIGGKLKAYARLLGIVLGVGVVLYFGSQIFSWKIPFNYIFIIPILVGIVAALIKAIASRSRIVFYSALFLLVSVGLSLSTDYVFEHVLDVHHQKRINDLLGIESDPLGWGYNVNQSKIAIGSGGFLGKGYLQGTQTKFNFVPEQSTDFIFCTVGEEWGFIGSFVVILLFAILLLRLLKIAERQRETFSRIYGYGVVSIMFFHVAINIGMTIGLVPVIGIPLPFFSYGGSSLWSFTLMVFILLKLDSDRYGALG